MPYNPFFAPRGVAVIGASADPTKLGYGLARNLLRSNFQGAVHLVNPKGGQLMVGPTKIGSEMIRSIADIPDPVDLAVLLIPAPAVPEALEACGQRGIPGVIIGSGGFRETGPEGAALENACLEIARRYGMRLVGPNCIGLLDTHLPIDATFLPPPGPLPGEVAFISHSGAICSAVIDWARGQSFGLSRLVSLGNQVDINETDMLEPVAADPFTHVITLYLEGVTNGRRFVETAARVSARKPIIALKVGRYAGGRRAVASHTGALAGEERAYDAAFRRAGVIRAETSEEMFDWARALAWCPLPQGRRVAVLTNAGGPGVTAADAIEANGLCLANLSDDTRRLLADQLPPAASLHNPVDMLASASPGEYASCLRVLLADPGVDMVMVIFPAPPMFTAGSVAKAIIPIIYSTKKPVVVALMGERLIQEAVEHFRAAHVPEYRFPERAASALAVLERRAEHLKRLTNAVSICGEYSIENARHILKGYTNNDFLPADVVANLLAIYEIDMPLPQAAHTADEAAVLASKSGFPVAVKVNSPDIIHKSDVDGVRLGLTSATGVAAAFDQVIANARRLYPDARIDGVHIQRMLPPGQDVIVGAVQDPQFGPLLMFGSGGIEVEGLKDVAFALAPITQVDIDSMLETTWAGRKLRGYRSLPPADQDAVRKAIARLGQLAADLPEIAEVEINPLRVFATGAAALDSRIRLR